MDCIWNWRARVQGEESGIPCVAVKCADIRKNTEWRRRLSGLKLTLRLESVGSKQDLDTLVVHAVNDDAQGCRGGILGAAANAISTHLGARDRKVETQRN